MSSENVKKVIARAVSDAGFRELLARNPDEALAGYDLTVEERSTILEGFSREGFDRSVSDLGDRVSRAGVHLDDFVGELIGGMDPDPVNADISSRDIGREPESPSPDPDYVPLQEAEVALPADPDVDIDQLATVGSGAVAGGGFDAGPGAAAEAPEPDQPLDLEVMDDELGGMSG